LWTEIKKNNKERVVKMKKTLPQEVVREMELELARERQLESRIGEAWAAYAEEIEVQGMKLAG